jgi:RNA polymerase sigma-54 factor
LNINEEELKKAIDEILKLNPKPGSSYSDPQNKNIQQIVPDFILENNDGELQLSLNARNVPELRISQTYSDLIEAYTVNRNKQSREQKDAITFVKQKLDSAKWFIEAIRQRQNTLMLTMEAIINYQKEYFKDGDEKKLKPMILKDIADITNLDISTISRVANSKYIQSHFGIFPLKYFFSEGLQTDTGEEVSTREIKKILEECIEKEDKRKPLTDEKLAEILKEKGYHIARRTVAKYREQLDIPVARLRKEL